MALHACLKNVAPNATNANGKAILNSGVFASVVQNKLIRRDYLVRLPPITPCYIVPS